MRTLAEHAFPARQGRSPGAIVLRDRGESESMRYVTHWRNDQLGGHHLGGYSATLDGGVSDFDARVAEEMAAQAEVNGPAPGPFAWELWGSHRDAGNDDLDTGDTCPTFAEALAEMRRYAAMPRFAHCAHACVVDAAGAVVHQEFNPSPTRTADDDDAARSEAANLAGMERGTQGRNEALGEEVEEERGFGMR